MSSSCPTRSCYHAFIFTVSVDIFVGFTPQNYTVSEGDAFVNVTVTASGFPGDTFGMVNVIVLLMTEDGTAEGKHIIIVDILLLTQHCFNDFSCTHSPTASIDFDGVIRQLVFSADGSWDVMIPIIDNAPIEATEFFTVGLTTINPFVVFNNSEATVAIIDNDSELYSPHTLYIVHHAHTLHCTFSV